MYYLTILSFLACLFQPGLLQNSNSRVNINEAIDGMLPEIRSVIKRSGFDPMRVPDISDYVTPLNVNMTQGIMSGAVGLKRSGDFYLTFHPLMVRIHARVHFPLLIGKFNYSISGLIFYTDAGKVNTKIHNVTAAIQIDAQIDTMTVLNPKLKIINYEYVDITMESDSYINWLKNVIANVALPFYKKKVISIAEKTALKLATRNINKVNKVIRETAGGAVDIMGFILHLFERKTGIQRQKQKLNLNGS